MHKDWIFLLNYDNLELGPLGIFFVSFLLNFWGNCCDFRWIFSISLIICVFISIGFWRYDELWMPLISDLMVGSTPPMVLPPLDIEWVWYCHTLNPVCVDFIFTVYLDFFFHMYFTVWLDGNVIKRCSFSFFYSFSSLYFLFGFNKKVVRSFLVCQSNLPFLAL